MTLTTSSMPADNKPDLVPEEPNSTGLSSKDRVQSVGNALSDGPLESPNKQHPHEKSPLKTFHTSSSPHIKNYSTNSPGAHGTKTGMLLGHSPLRNRTSSNLPPDGSPLSHQAHQAKNASDHSKVPVTRTLAVTSPAPAVSASNSTNFQSPPKEAKIVTPIPPSVEDSYDLSSAKNNPKFSRMIQHIEVVTERTRAARQELERMMSLTRELEEQCVIQEQECVALEADQGKVKEEIDTLTQKIHVLVGEKVKVETKLEELKMENSKLDTFLQQAARDVAAEQ